jgi:type IX secretion system PorP/SprF family membrane protein
MKKLILIFYAFVLWTSAFSQQEREVSQYMFDHISVNPGSAGSSDMISTHAIMRQQWVGIDGAPADLILNLSAPIKLGTSHHGVGLSIWSDELGFTKDIDMTLSYAYQFSIGNGRLGFGISGSGINRSLNATWNVLDLSSDGAIPKESQSEFAFDLGAGLFYHTEELYFGFSSTHLLQNGYNYQPQETSVGDAREKLIRQYYLTAGYNLQLSNPALDFMPSVFVQSDTRITRIDLNVTLMYNKKFWGGVSYRVGSAVVGMIGLSILNGVKVGYSYDFDTSALSKFSNGTHEVMVGYDFRVGIDKIPQKYKSIRYL